MDVTLESVKDEAHSIRTFWFRPDEPVDYVAGQFTQLHLPLENSDERGDKRWFTLSSSPTEELVSITTKFAPRSSTFKSALSSLRPGTKLKLAEPMGDFVLPKDKTRPLLFIAGGLGITPYRSMIKWLADTGQKRDIHLIHSVSDARDLAFRELFGSHNSKFTPMITGSKSVWQDERLTAERLYEIARLQGGKTLIYIAGPEPMVERLVGDMKQLGVSGQRLVTDYFPGYV